MKSKRSKNKSASKKLKRNWIVISAALVFCCIWSWIPCTEHIALDLPSGESDESFRVALITDLHSCYYGHDQNTLIKMVEKENPDLVILGGDIFDDKLGDQNAQIAVSRLAEKYPTYYVSGNHEFWSKRADEMKAYVRSTGAVVLEGDCETVNVNGRMIDICGVDDPDVGSYETWVTQLKDAYSQCDDSHLKILVSHRPEKTAFYEQYDFDLVLTGHAHAGQFRIPFSGRGVYAPDQGLFPKYISGEYELKNGSRMIVSRGLARESTPAPRFFNRPEIVVIDIS